MPRYAKIVAGEVAKVRKFGAAFDPAEVAHKHDWRLVVTLADPTPGVDERLGPRAYTIFADHVDEVRTVVAMTQEECDIRDDLADTQTKAQAVIGITISNGLNDAEIRKIARFVKKLARREVGV